MHLRAHTHTEYNWESGIPQPKAIQDILARAHVSTAFVAIN